MVLLSTVKKYCSVNSRTNDRLFFFAAFIQVDMNFLLCNRDGATFT